jgi:hypothetical protein
VFDELVLDEPLMRVVPGEAVDLVAASAWPTPIPPTSVPAASVTATAPRRSFGAIVDTTSFRLVVPATGPPEPWDQR